MYSHLNGAHSRIRVGEFKIGRIAASREPHLTNDVQNDPEVSNPEWAAREGMVAFAGHPLLIGDRLLGVLAVFSREPFDASTLLVLATIASLISHGVDREWLREKTEGALRATERSNEALQRFAAVASHDLQEPLRQVTAFSQMLVQFHSNGLDNEGREYLGFIVDGAGRMARLIHGLLAYAQVEAMESTLVGQAEMQRALSDALGALDLSVKESHAVITHDPLPEIRGDQSQLTQLFQNLIGNAMKYRSAAAPQIHISASQSGSNWIFSVADNGVGVPVQHRTKIFGVFTRLHGKEISGAGLGLAFCSKIVELHHGSIWVEANPSTPTGAIFRFAIPV
jgi:light-regulated signal transduction histidine kinase (bacteriophytochrome)